MKIDLSALSPDAVSDETRAFNAKLEETLASLPATHTVPPQIIRQARKEGKGVFPPAGPLEGSHWMPAPTETGEVRVTPAPGKPRGIYFQIHGGGWTLGDPDQCDLYNQRLAAATGLTVVSPRYRLAPEHPWPAQGDDCEAAARWLVDAAEKEFGTERLFIGGESAGAHLAAVTLLRLRNAGLGDAFSGAVLFYGCFDQRMTPSIQGWGDRNLILSTPTVNWFRGHTWPEPEMWSDPDVSPLLADLTGMPPAIFHVGTADPLMDDSILMAGRWTAFGGQADLRIYPGGVHAFDRWDIGIARDCHGATEAFLNDLLGGAPA